VSERVREREREREEGGGGDRQIAYRGYIERIRTASRDARQLSPECSKVRNVFEVAPIFREFSTSLRT